MKYPTRRILGEGSFAVTFLSEDENGRPVVVKRFKTAIQYKDENKWEREANLLRALDHIQIPRYVDHYIEKVEERRLPHLVMAFVEGQTMQDVWKLGGYTEGQVLGWIQQILQILSYLQALSPPVMHRDIKPSNLLLTNDGQIFLVDFGSAIDDISRTFGHSFTGSLGYQSPEQIRGEPTIRSDLYSVGALAVGLLCGKDPSQMLDGMRLRWEDTCLHLPMRLQNWLDKMLAYDPNDRFAHAKDALKALPSNASIPNIPAAVIRKTEGATDLFAELLAEEEEKQQEVDTAKRRAKLAAEEEKRREAALVERKRILAQRRQEEAAQRKARAIASLDAQEKAFAQDLERDWKRGLAAIGAQRIQPEALVRVVKKAFSDRTDLAEDGFTRTISHPIWLFALQYQSGVYSEESLIYFEYIMAHVSSEIKADVDIQQKEDMVKAAEEKKKEARKELNGLTLFQGLFQREKYRLQFNSRLRAWKALRQELVDMQTRKTQHLLKAYWLPFYDELLDLSALKTRVAARQKERNRYHTAVRNIIALDSQFLMIQQLDTGNPKEDWVAFAHDLKESLIARLSVIATANVIRPESLETYGLNPINRFPMDPETMRERVEDVLQYINSWEERVAEKEGLAKQKKMREKSTAPETLRHIVEFEEEVIESSLPQTDSSELYRKLNELLGDLRDRYGQDVSHLFHALEERIDEKTYRDLSEELNRTWLQLLKWHQRKNQRIPPQVVHAFNEMNRLLKMT